jgi:hypothetical protein
MTYDLRLTTDDLTIDNLKIGRDTALRNTVRGSAGWMGIIDG